MADTALTTDRLQKTLDRFQKAAASKPYLEKELADTTAEVNQLAAQIQEKARALGYDPASGTSLDEYVAAMSANVELSLSEFEKALQ